MSELIFLADIDVYDPALPGLKTLRFGSRSLPNRGVGKRPASRRLSRLAHSTAPLPARQNPDQFCRSSGVIAPAETGGFTPPAPPWSIFAQMKNEAKAPVPER